MHVMAWVNILRAPRVRPLSCLPKLVSACAIFAALLANFVVRFDLGYRGCARS